VVRAVGTGKVGGISQRDNDHIKSWRGYLRKNLNRQIGLVGNKEADRTIVMRHPVLMMMEDHCHNER
jgi:hypothetical protein